MNNTTQKNEQQDYETHSNQTVREAFAIGYNTGYEHGQGLSLEPLAIAQDAIDLIKWFHGKATPEDTEEMNAVFDAGDFREFVDRHAALMCRMAQHKKNPTGQEVRIAELERELAEEKNHRLQAQKALMFWLPMVPSEPQEVSERAAHDARLLYCYEGDEEPSAEQLGWISLSRPSSIRAQAMDLAADILESLADDQPINGNHLAASRVLMAAGRLRNGEMPDAIRSLASQPVQDGYVLVPVEPTDAMLQAAWDSCSFGDETTYRECWKAMLSAAPTAAQRKGEE